MAKRDSNYNTLGGSRGLQRNGGGTADWAVADCSKLRDAICAAAITGGALRFGYSRDGGAYAIGIYGDGEPYTEFVQPGENIDSILDDIIRLFGDIRDSGTLPPTPR